MPTRERKRFIAGAVCPRCGVQDRIVLFTEQSSQVPECIDCGFSDEQPEPGAGALPEGRLDTPQRAPEPGAQPLFFQPRPPDPARDRDRDDS